MATMLAGKFVSKYGVDTEDCDDHFWSGIRQIAVFEGLLAKFSQNGELRNRLTMTGDAILAGCAVKDRVWGIGLSMEDPNRFDGKKWKGRNLLGYTPMMVREQL